MVSDLVEQVVGLNAQAFPARDLDERASVILGLIAKGLGRGLGERHHLVGEVDGTLRFVRMVERRQRLNQQLLQVTLTRIDDVVDRSGLSERWDWPLSAVGRRVAAGRRPERAAGVLVTEQAVAEVLAQEPELPELLGDVLAPIGHRPVRTNDDLEPRVEGVGGVVRDVLVFGQAFVDRHHPAAGQQAVRL